VKGDFTVYLSGKIEKPNSEHGYEVKVEHKQEVEYPQHSSHILPGTSRFDHKILSSLLSRQLNLATSSLKHSRTSRTVGSPSGQGLLVQKIHHLKRMRTEGNPNCTTPLEH